MLATAADMPGPIHITLIALLASCEAFKLGPLQHVIPLARLLQEDSPTQELVRTERVHEVALELVRAQPHLVHDMGTPEIHETSRSKTKMDAAAVNNTQSNQKIISDKTRVVHTTAGDENRDVEDEMERMVHLVDPESSRGQAASSDPETVPPGGHGAGETSLEASGFYGTTDTEERERERRGGGGEEEEWDRDDQDVHITDPLELSNHTTPDLDALIGYSPSFDSSTPQKPDISPPVEVHDSGPQEHRASPVLEVGPLERELWEEDTSHSSGFGILRSSIKTTVTTTTSTATATLSATLSATAGGVNSMGTATPETDTGTDFGLLGTYTKDGTEDEEMEREEEEEEREGLVHGDLFTQNPTVPDVAMAPSREPLQPSVEEELRQPGGQGFGLEDRDSEEEEDEETIGGHIAPLTTDPPSSSSASERFTEPLWDWLTENTPPVTSQPEATPPVSRSRLRGGARGTEVSLPEGEYREMDKARQVMCLNWSELAGRGYVLLNMTKNMNCEEFRVDQGVRLLKVIERVFARRMNSPEGSWGLYLSKPTHQHHELVMNVASQRGVIATSEVLGMLGEIRESLLKVGIQSYSAASSCSSRPSQTRSDYGKLFVVLVIIGSVCLIIITSGFIYICWQRRLPATKTQFRGEELHFVENGCHDNPTLDVAGDSQEPEMQEKKPTANGIAASAEEGGTNGKRWQVFVNQGATEEEEEEQDTHL